MNEIEIGLKPAAAQLTLVKGDQWRRSLTLHDADSAYNATGATLSASVTRSAGGAEVFAPTLTVVNASLGQYTIDISETQSAALTASDPRNPNGWYWLTLRLQDAAGVTMTLAQIRVQVVP